MLFCLFDPDFFEFYCDKHLKYKFGKNGKNGSNS